MNEWSQYAGDVFGLKLLSLGTTTLTLGGLVAALCALVLLLMFARWLRHSISQRLVAHGYLDVSTGATVASLTQYIVVTIGVVSILNGIGLQLSSLTVLAGAFGVGVGFGLQNVFSNFISGLIVMFERPVKIGDHVQIAGADGDVVRIGMRATTLRTAQGSLVIIPNQTLITGNVTNFDQVGSSALSLQYRMAGAVNEDQALLLQVLAGHPDVLKAPAPTASVVAADHGGHVLEVHFGVHGGAASRMRIISEIHAAVLTALTAAGQSLAAA